MSRTGLIVGAGVAGLTAAAELAGRGIEVRVIEKGRGVGGRLATRSFDGAVFDHGAQYYTARSAEFQSQTADWQREDTAEAWFVGPPAHVPAPASEPDDHTRFRGTTGMTALAKSLAEGVEVSLDERLTNLEYNGGRWRALSDTGTSWEADFVILTPPVPQSLTLLEAGKVPLGKTHRATLEAIDYDPCLAVMALLEGPSLLEPPGALSLDHPILAWIADNHQKGISSLEGSVTVHGAPAWSREHFKDDGDRIADLLLSAAEPWLGHPVYRWQLHRWRYAKPQNALDIGCLVLPDLHLIFAGDAFTGPRVEGAYLSGLAAAREVLKG